MKKKFVVIIPTYNGGDIFVECLKSLRLQDLQPESVLVIDSSSSDSTVCVAESFGCTVEIIKKEDFNHGGTRQQAFRQVTAEYVILLTQDAVLVRKDAISQILRFAIDNRLAAVCGRQVPHVGASPIAAHARHFNYPEQSYISTANDIPLRGLKAAFCSNSFALYDSQCLAGVGGFPGDVIFGEDMCVAAKMILSGLSVGYCSTAVAMHSHNYSVKEDFNRSFDIGVLHRRESWLLDNFGGAGGEGLRFVRSEIKYCLALRRVDLVVVTAVRTLTKYLAYRLGLLESFLPETFKRKVSLNKRYWSDSKKI